MGKFTVKRSKQAIGYSRSDPRYMEEWYKRNGKRIQRKVFDGYGDKCACCGENDYNFLSLDHVRNDGKEERKVLPGGQSGCFRAALRENFPDRYQILCYNCNMSKQHRHGECAHKSLNSKFEAGLSAGLVI